MLRGISLPDVFIVIRLAGIHMKRRYFHDVNGIGLHSAIFRQHSIINRL